MAKLPAMQWYPGDWRKDPGIQSLEFFERGVWFEMLQIMHESEHRGKLILNGRAMTHKQISSSIGLDNQTFNQTITTLLESGVASIDEKTGAICNRRMVRDENLRKVRTEAGKKGGNPLLVKHFSTNEDKQITTPTVRKMKSEEEELVSCISPEMIAKEVQREAKLSSDPVFMAVRDQAGMEMIGEGFTEDEADALVKVMADAWKHYAASIGSLQIVRKAQDFYSEGMWRNDQTWPWKEGNRTDGSNKRTSPTSDRVNGNIAAIAQARRRAGFGPDAGTDVPAVPTPRPVNGSGGVLPGLHGAGGQVRDRSSPPGTSGTPGYAGPEILSPAK